MITNYVDFIHAIESSISQLRQYGAEVDTGRWQGVPTEGKPDLVTLELLDCSFRVSMDQYHLPFGNLDALREQIQPNLPWADDHFEERVSRVPSNPGEQYKNWPWWKNQDAAYAQDQNLPINVFTHTYQERFWPKWAADRPLAHPAPMRSQKLPADGTNPLKGIRYEYGDLDDVVNMLLADPYTRQAYLPIFFPEDTGAVHGGRIPCSLGYHFLLRNGQLHLWYEIRSCDAVRHFRDDVYLAARLALWVIEECQRRSGYEVEAPWGQVTPGILTFSAHSFHVHKGDLHLI